jgi:chorismate-pyruvate lyase
MSVKRLLLAAAMASLGASAAAQEQPTWPDTYVARLQALALVQTLNGKILASRSATLTLEAWCHDHHLADEDVIAAEVVRGVTKAATPEQRRRLQVGPNTEVKYRRVRLRCGSRVLSEAENWYVPDRLTAEMNHSLDVTNTAFGRVVQSLKPYRETFDATILWSPLPEGWERSQRPAAKVNAQPLAIPDALFEHRAIVYTGQHIPISEVDEVYQKQLLAFPAPQ